MQPHILEKALHAWPQWGEFIREARIKMNFKPALLQIDGEAQKWEKEVGWQKAIGLGLEALRQMGLPWYFGFYWLACFCADYERGDSIDFSGITSPPQKASAVWTDLLRKKLLKDRGTVLLYHKKGPGNKLYPPYPFILETDFPFGIQQGKKPSDSMTYGIVEFEKNGEKHKVDGLFELDKNGNLIPSQREMAAIVAPRGTDVQFFLGETRIPPELRVEFPMFLATEDVVDMAFKQIQVYRKGVRHYMSHPLLKYIGPAKVSIDEGVIRVRREAKEDIARYQKGELTFTDLILREWERELKQGGTIAVKLKNKQISESRAATVIYHRLRRRLQRSRLIPPRPQKGWRSKLKL